MTTAHMYGMTADGIWAPMLTTGIGGGSGGGGGGGGEPTVPWTYAAGSGGITDTSDVTLVAAAGISKANYLTAVQIINGDTGASTEVVIKDGSTVIWREYLVASAGIAVQFPTPLYSSDNTALKAAAITTSSKIYINAQGYQDYGVGNRLAAVTDGNKNELLDDNGNLIYDTSVLNNQIYHLA